MAAKGWKEGVGLQAALRCKRNIGGADDLEASSRRRVCRCSSEAEILVKEKRGWEVKFCPGIVGGKVCIKQRKYDKRFDTFNREGMEARKGKQY